MGVVRGPREVDPKIQSDSWMAWARGPEGERVDENGASEGRAPSPSIGCQNHLARSCNRSISGGLLPLGTLGSALPAGLSKRVLFG